MIRKLSRRLTLLFAGVTSLILTLLLCVAFLYQDTQLETQTDQSFQRYLTEIKHRLELDSSLSDEWLARVEVEGRLIIYIEDNGRPLFFPVCPSPKALHPCVPKALRQCLVPGQNAPCHGGRHPCG